MQIPAPFVERLCAAAEEIQGEELWPDLYHDHDSEIIVGTLAAAAPERAAKMVQGWVQNMAGRGSIGAWRLALEVTGLQLFLSEKERPILLDLWTHLTTKVGLDRNEDLAEAFLFGMLLPEMEAEEQLERILIRREVARDLRRFEAAFRPLDLPALFQLEFDNATSASGLVRILWFLSVNAEYLPRDVVERISAECAHNDKMVRLCALRILCRSGFSMAGHWLAGSGWQALPKNELESFWGSLILAEHGHHLSWKELVHRIDPSYLGYAVEERGFRPDEIESYALALGKAWSSLSGVKSEAPPEVPAIEVLVNVSERSAPQLRQLRLFEEDESHGITWIRRDSTWGGKEEAKGLEMERLLEPSEEQDRLKREAVEAEIQRQRDLGNYWFGREFYTNALDRVLTQSPELLERWLSAEDQVVRRLDSFYRGLCHVLLKSRTGEGLSLYHRLKNIRFRNHATWSGGDLLDLYLFEAPATLAIESAWEERLDACRSDRDLLELVIAGEKGNGASWLWRVCERDLSTPSPFRQARASTLLGFSNLPFASQILTDRISQGGEESWLVRTARKALLSWRKNDWARHWHRIFLSSESDAVSGAAFQLFLRCVDRRYWVWEARQREFKALSQGYWRRKFFYKNNESTIENHIKDNEKELGKTFAGCKVLKDEASPWIEQE